MLDTKDQNTLVKSRSILIVEDNPVNMKLAKILIGHQFKDLTILEAENGEEAVLKFKEEKPDIILMDIQMPVMHGFDATRAIREIEKEIGGRTPIIALTASIIQDEMPACIDAGMDDFLNKPIVKDKLYALLNTWLNNEK